MSRRNELAGIPVGLTALRWLTRSLPGTSVPSTSGARSISHTHPSTDFASAPPTSEAYHVVNRYVGPAAPQMQSTVTAVHR
jgi:hypothetical protein